LLNESIYQKLKKEERKRKGYKDKKRKEKAKRSKRNNGYDILTFGELRRVVAVTKVIPLVLSYTGGFHSASTSKILNKAI
jgi:hypothetical protein